MYRRAAYVLGLALLLATVVAVPARGAVCEELQYADVAGPKGQVVANMDGMQVVDSSEEPGKGDPDGTGTVLLTLQSVVKKEAEVAYQVGTNNIALPLLGAHIHKAPAEERGLSVKQLFGDADQPDQNGTVTMSKCLAHDIFHRPAGYYVDVHNYEYPDHGAVRGQLSEAD